MALRSSFRWSQSWLNDHSAALQVDADTKSSKSSCARPWGRESAGDNDIMLLPPPPPCYKSTMGESQQPPAHHLLAKRHERKVQDTPGIVPNKKGYFLAKQCSHIVVLLKYFLLCIHYHHSRSYWS